MGKTQGALVKWTPLSYESYVSTDGTGFARYADILLANGPKPDKDTYIVTGSTPLTTITALRLDTLTNDSLPQKAQAVRTTATSRSASLKRRSLNRGRRSQPG